MTLLERWFKRKVPDDQRRGERCQWPQLVAHYWTGAAPKAIRVGSISSSGIYLLTEESWYPGTVVKITLQRTNEGSESSGHSIVVHSRVVRRDADGMGLEFVLAKKQTVRSEQSSQDIVADRESMALFLERLLQDGSKMFLEID